MSTVHDPFAPAPPEGLGGDDDEGPHLEPPGEAEAGAEVGASSAVLGLGADDHGAPAASEALKRLGGEGDVLLPVRPRLRKRVWTTYKEKVARLSDRIVRAQKPIRILDAIKWGDDVVRAIVADRFKRLPVVGRRYYGDIPLGFDPEKKVEEFEHVKRDVRRFLGAEDALGKILLRTADQYQQVVRMLEARGTREFYRRSRELYGSPKDRFIDDQTTIRDMGQTLYQTLDGLDERELGERYERTLRAEDVVGMLNVRFREYFKDHHVHARLDDGIVSDAAAGADYIKIKKGVLFSSRDVDILEVHEGWAHVGTTLNGKHQRVARWLAKGPPCTCAVQEGLAVFLEMVTFNSEPARAKKLNNRILAVDKAEDGANLLDIIEFYRTEGYSEVECITNAQRIFRGGVVKGGAPFTKDISYCKGFIANFNFIRTCIKLSRPELIPFLFVGKVTLEDVPVLYHKWREGVIDRPLYVPKPFRDLNGLAMWMAYANFFGRMNLGKIHDNLKPLILGV